MASCQLWIFTTVVREDCSLFHLAFVPGRGQTDHEEYNALFDLAFVPGRGQTDHKEFNALCLSIFVSEIMHSIVGSGPLEASPFLCKAERILAFGSSTLVFDLITRRLPALKSFVVCI